MNDRWIHRDCGQPVIFDMSGAFCLGCHAEGLDEDDLVAPVAETTATCEDRQET